jgi:predicted amidohydrolase
MRLLSLGEDRGRGNLLGIEPHLTVADYRSAERLQETLGARLRAARDARLLGERTVVVFPEYTGTWLVAADESERVFRAARVADAARAIALRHPVAFLVGLGASRGADRASETLFRLKARRVAAHYQRIFSSLAAQFRVTTVAGSIVLPAPSVREGILCPGNGPLFNVSAVFGPDGRISPRLARKCHPTADEQGFISAGAASDLPCFETPAGRLGVLVCADSWFPDCWARMQDLGVETIAVVSFAQGDGSMMLPWKGYSGAPLPHDVDPADVGRITEGQAWQKYAMAGRIGSCRARCGVNVFLRGRLWDLGSDGVTTLAWDGDVLTDRPDDSGPGGTLACCWL